MTDHRIHTLLHGLFATHWIVGSHSNNLFLAPATSFWELFYPALVYFFSHQTGSLGDFQILTKISNNIHDILTAMEELVDDCSYTSSHGALFSFIELCAASRPVSRHCSSRRQLPVALCRVLMYAARSLSRL